MRESPVSQRVLLAASERGTVLMRNNSGACVDATGRHIRYGLMNESAKQNRKIKSSDYIGITPVTAYVEGVGWTVLGVFTAIETKRSDWKFNPNDKREVAQQKFIDIVRQYGGFAGFATGPEDVERICKK